jgi:hypothetical protein
MPFDIGATDAMGGSVMTMDKFGRFRQAAIRAVCRGAVAAALLLLAAAPAKATTYVLMDFDGDALFPSLTYQANTAGLAGFTGSAFGLDAAGRDAVVAQIMTLVAADYAAYDISFVTDTTGLSSWYTWGIDDTAYVFSDSLPNPGYNPINPYAACPGGLYGDCYRLYGKALGGSAAFPNDAAGNSIVNPTYARTWAGSFALGAGTADPSSPSLFGASTTAIAQALGNSAAHEIAHLFGVGHPASCGAGSSCTDLMWASLESVESTVNKSFSAGDHAILLAALGAAGQTPGGGDNGTAVPEPSTVTLLGLGAVGLIRVRRRDGTRRLV